MVAELLNWALPFLQYLNTKGVVSTCLWTTFSEAVTEVYLFPSQLTPAADLGLINCAKCAPSNSCSLTPDFMGIPLPWNRVAMGTHPVTFLQRELFSSPQPPCAWELWARSVYYLITALILGMSLSSLLFLKTAKEPPKSKFSSVSSE